MHSFHSENVPKILLIDAVRCITKVSRARSYGTMELSQILFVLV